MGEGTQAVRTLPPSSDEGDMKSDCKSYRVMCDTCHQIKRVTAYLMDRVQILLYCKHCHGQTVHTKKD